MIAMIAIAVVVLALVAWYRTSWALALVIIGTPAYLLKTEITGIPVTVLEALIVGTALGWLARSLIRKQWSAVRGVWNDVPRQLWLAAAVIAVGWILATIVSVDVRASLGALKAWLVEPALIGLIALAELRDESRRMLLQRAALLTLSWVSLAGIIQVVFVRSTVEDGRLSSVFAPVANYFAMFAVPLIVVAIGMIIMHRERLLASCAAFLGVAALALSFSYGGFLAFGVGAVVLLATLVPPMQRKRALLALVTLGIVAFVALLPTRLFHEKLNFSTRSSSLVRTEIWRTALEIGMQHPLLGIGPNTFETEYRIVAPTLYHPPLEWLVAKPHSLYLNAWVETGLLGLVGLMWFMVVFLVRLFRSRGPDAKTAWIVGAAAAAILVHGLVDTPLFKNDLSALAAIIIALGLAASSASSTRE